MLTVTGPLEWCDMLTWNEIRTRAAQFAERGQDAVKENDDGRCLPGLRGAAQWSGFGLFGGGHAASLARAGQQKDSPAVITRRRA